MKDILAVIAALITVASVIPYLLDVIKRKTKPNIVTWFTWTVLTGVATAAAFAAHEPRTALLTLASSICTGLVVLLGLRFGIARFSIFDIVCQIGAVLGLILWLVFNSPTIGVVVPVIIDLIALLPTIRHAWLRPDEETWQAFAISGAAAIITLLSLSRYNTVSLLYPLYLVVANSVTASVILSRLQSKAQIKTT